MSGILFYAFYVLGDTFYLLNKKWIYECYVYILRSGQNFFLLKSKGKKCLTPNLAIDTRWNMSWYYIIDFFFSFNFCYTSIDQLSFITFL